MSSIEKALELIDGNRPKEGLRILHELLNRPHPPKNTYIVWSAILWKTPFKYLALEAARKEFQIHSCSEAKAFASKLIRESFDARRLPAGQLPMISVLGVLTASSLPSWTRCFKSLNFQQYPNVELCLAATEDVVTNFPSFVKVVRCYGSPLEGYQTALETCVGEVVTIVETPETIFSDTGLYAVANVFGTKSEIQILQTERIYSGEAEYPVAMRFNFPEWNCHSLFDPENLLQPSVHFGWQGVFFRSGALKMTLPFDESYTHASALDAISKLVPRFSVDIGGFSALLSKVPVSAKSRLLSREEISESLSIIEREKPKYINMPAKAAAHDLTELKPSAEMPSVAPSILLRGEESNLRISLVTASFNCREFIEPCLDSILSQNYKNLEYIVLDGGSTDGTNEILERYKKYFSFYRSSPDGGHYAAIQEGLSKSTGSVMSWLNADDLLTPYSLRLLSHLFSDRPDVQWVTGKPALISENNDLDIAKFTMEHEPEHYLNDGFDDPFIQQEGTFWRRELWERAGATLNLELKLAGDMELWTRFFQLAPVHTVTVPLGVFRKRRGQRSEVFKRQYYREAADTTLRLKATNARAAVKDEAKSYTITL